MTRWQKIIVLVLINLSAWQVVMLCFPVSLGLWRLWPLIGMAIFWMIMGAIATKKGK